MDWKSWAPFQSKISREICDHMTVEEKKELAARSGKYGVWCALTFAIPINQRDLKNTFKSQIKKCSKDNYATGADGVKIAVLRKSRASLA